MDKNPIKNQNAPLLVGLDHDDKTLAEKAEQVIEQFGRRGKTLFVEGSTLSILGRKDSFVAAERKAAEKGMVIVKLDSSRTGKIKKRMTYNDGIFPILARLNLDEYRYLQFQLREKRWVGILKRQAIGGDIVLAHPHHITRIKAALSHFGIGQNVLFVSEPLPKRRRELAIIPLTTKNVAKLKKWRAAKRPINLKQKK